MSDIKTQENQQEFFSDFARDSRRPERVPSIAKTQKPILISTTLEQIILTGIVSILIFCLVFFLGMLRGRYMTNARIAASGQKMVSSELQKNNARLPGSPQTSSSTTGAGAKTRRLYIPKIAAAASPSAKAVQGIPVVRVTKVTATAKKDSLLAAVKAQIQKPYTIQVLTTKKKSYADQESLFLRKSGYNSWTAPSSEYYVVCVGTYANREEAKKDLSYFVTKYKSSYLRRR